jgi:hypothetical protein
MVDFYEFERIIPLVFGGTQGFLTDLELTVFN